MQPEPAGQVYFVLKPAVNPVGAVPLPSVDSAPPSRLSLRVTFLFTSVCKAFEKSTDAVPE